MKISRDERRRFRTGGFWENVLYSSRRLSEGSLVFTQFLRTRSTSTPKKKRWHSFAGRQLTFMQGIIVQVGSNLMRSVSRKQCILRMVTLDVVRTHVRRARMPILTLVPCLHAIWRTRRGSTFESVFDGMRHGRSILGLAPYETLEYRSTLVSW